MYSVRKILLGVFGCILLAICFFVAQQTRADWVADVTPPTTTFTASGTGCTLNSQTNTSCPNGSSASISITSCGTDRSGCTAGYPKYYVSASATCGDPVTDSAFFTQVGTPISVNESNGSVQYICIFGIDGAGNIERPAKRHVVTFEYGISGTVYNDANHNTTLGDAGDSRYSSGATVSLSGGSSTTTDGNGNYTFSAGTGTYTITLTIPPGFQSTVPAVSTTTVTLSAAIGPSVANKNFGITRIQSIAGTVFVDDDKNNVKNPDGSEVNYTGGTSTIKIANSSDVTCATPITILTPGNGVFSYTNLLSGTYNVCYTSLPNPPYNMTHPTGSPPSYSVTIGSGCATSPQGYWSCDANGNVQNLNFGISNSNPWWQCINGDCKKDSGISNDVPSGGYMSIAANFSSSSGNSPGVVATGTTSSTNFGSGQVSSTGLLVKNTFTPAGSNVIRTSYAYYQNILRPSGITPTALTSTHCSGNALTSCTLSSSGVTFPNGVYQVNGSLTLNASTFPVNKRYVMLVSGDLIINGNILVPTSSSVIFSVAGDIRVRGSVGETTISSRNSNIEGLYSTDKNFIIEGTNDCTITADKRLNIRGAVVINASHTGGVVDSRRDLCAGNLSYPTYTIIEQLTLILNAPEFIKHPTYIWREVAPSATLYGPVSTPTSTPIVSPTALPTPSPTPAINPTFTHSSLRSVTGMGVVDNEVWISNFSHNTISRFRFDETFIGEFAVGSGPWGITQVEGLVWVAETNGRRISIFNPNTTSTGASITGSYLVYPRCPAVIEGSVWVTDNGSPGNRDGVEIYNPDRTYTNISTYDPAKSNGPRCLSAVVAPSGTEVWIANIGDSTISRFSTDLTYLGRITGNGLNQPRYVANVGNQVWVTNEGGNSISRFNPDRTVAQTPLTGNGLNRPGGMAIVGSYVWVANIGTNTISVFFVPPAPTGLAATYRTSDYQVDVSWNNVAGVQYNLYRSTAVNGTYTLVTTTANLTYRDNPAPGSTYYYKVSSVKSGIEGAKSSSAFVVVPLPPAPSAPTNVAATLNNANLTVTLAWNAPTPPPTATGYKVYRALRDFSTGVFGPYTSVDSTTTTSYTDTPLTGQTYQYKVSAVNGASPEGPQSSASNAVQTFKYVFVTSQTYDGDLKRPQHGEPAGTGSDGLDGADKKCKYLADNTTSLSGKNWKAWLSTDTISPTTPSRLFYQSPWPYININTAFANSFSDLISITSSLSFLYSELNTSLEDDPIRAAWTNTKADGTVKQSTDKSCTNWTHNNSAELGWRGSLLGASARYWTDLGSTNCNESRRLYCFEQ